ncbi:hypothetical protein BU24DRAFT_405649 [Aaosphaeria arxii CBS 175.79]|uniref:Uncharacterized protein n=1 Tax=Aaosphaeria arxii CBS 175.79 TaxID=1450172 RepID=A0A6A5Y141_9PLEO|nr:uncharacterized protein BU24DRAFT_405649 [Aaosphaeria arxii CBS 175.79]KAF2018913.1 hypothetical protein BU24DRAFT_405649 [Aaosphaeria arxii CBS 175.79]
MSSVATSAAAPSATSCTQQSFSDYPTQDVFCAFDGRSGIPDKYEDHFKTCCKDAPVQKWANDCSLYCLSAGQPVSSLISCLQEQGVTPGLIFCNGNNTMTATATDLSPTKPTGTAGSGSGTSGPRQSTGAAVPAVVPQGVSKAGLGMLAMIAISAFAGAML